MPKINLLPKNVAELIAAGEVVERPASVIKELVENSIDAGATAITVEIQHGGITLMRVTDNGCGISYEDVPLAFLRHATSKIKVGTDLDAIGSLGFRGEALAAVSSVARTEMLTKTAGADFGTRYIISGGEELVYEEAGCPQGTTIFVRDLFFNTPARMKFLKKDVSEANAVSAVVDRIAMSHPEISFKMIKDSKITLSTAGDGSLEGVIYSVRGRDFSKSLIPAKGELAGISVEGFVSRPVFCSQTRNNQFSYLNGRLVRSGTIMAAVEQAYKNSTMIGKFPGFILNVTVPLEAVDVNVHPAKTEVRFSDERRIFDAVYSTVKNAILKGDSRPIIDLKPKISLASPENITNEKYSQSSVSFEKTVKSYENNEPMAAEEKKEYKPSSQEISPVRLNESGSNIFTGIRLPSAENEAEKSNFTPKKSVDIEKTTDEKPEDIRLVGEAFSTYIIVETQKGLFFIDKHAAHERILFNRLKKEEKIEVQSLLSPLPVALSKEDYDLIITGLDLIEKSGFEIEDFGNGNVLVRAVPAALTGQDIPLLISEIAASLASNRPVSSEKLDSIYHTVACKAAIKAGFKTTAAEQINLARQVLQSDDIMYCPHGRPVAYELKKSDLEKQFGRIQ